MNDSNVAPQDLVAAIQRAAGRLHGDEALRLVLSVEDGLYTARLQLGDLSHWGATSEAALQACARDLADRLQARVDHDLAAIADLRAATEAP